MKSIADRNFDEDVFISCFIFQSLFSVIGWLRRFSAKTKERIQGGLQSRPVGSQGGAGPNNLLKFVDFVSGKGCNSQGRRNEDSNSDIFEEATRIYQKCNIFRYHRSLKFQNFYGKTPISRDPVLPSMAHFPTMSVFQRSKGRGHGKFS